MEDDLLTILEPFVGKALKWGADEVELYAERQSIKNVNFETNTLKSGEAKESEGVGIRVLVNNALGFISTNSITEEKISEGLKEAIALAKVSPREEYQYLPSKESITFVSNIYDKNIESFSMAEVIDYSQNLLKTAIELDSRASAAGRFEVITHHRAIMNSNNIRASEKKSSFTYGLHGMAVDGDDIGSSDFEYDSIVKAKDINIERIAEEFSKKVIGNLGAKKTEAFEGVMVLAPDAIPGLFNLLLSSATATTIQAGGSYLQDKLGTKIALDQLTFYDDATFENSTKSSSFDREGVPRKKLSIIEKGIFTGILYNSFAANRENLNSSGHASGTFRNVPSISANNLFVNPGTMSIDAIIKEIDHGVFVQTFNAFPDPVSGDFSCVIQGGKLIRKGEKTDTLKEITAVGNIFTGLKNITHISKEIKPIPRGQNWWVPFIAIDGIKFVS